jgi:hypothetical protein
VRRGSLISASCTTGWLDWIGVELWLLPDGILRLALNLAKTKEHRIARTVSDEPRIRPFRDDEIRALVAQGSRNVWISADLIAAARLRVGIVSDRLRLTLVDGTTVKLLWLRADHADDPLRDALASWGVEVVGR